jgi:hypothetical protein
MKTVSFSGAFDTGKTFITNLLAGTDLLSSDVEHTRGLSLYQL